MGSLLLLPAKHPDTKAPAVLQPLPGVFLGGRGGHFIATNKKLPQVCREAWKQREFCMEAGGAEGEMEPGEVTRKSTRTPLGCLPIFKDNVSSCLAKSHSSGAGLRAWIHFKAVPKASHSCEEEFLPPWPR